MLPGFHDTAAAAVPFFSRILESKAADQFGSLPSLHVTWALWVAVASQALVRHRALRAALWAYPALTVLDVIATANHYMLDVITAPPSSSSLTRSPGSPHSGAANGSGRYRSGHRSW